MAHVEIPGYDYDPKLSRYFKRSSYSAKIWRKDGTPKRGIIKRRSKSFRALNLVGHLRKRSISVESNDSVMDEMVVPFYREDLDVGRQLSSTIRCENSTVTDYSHFTRSIRDLKIDESGRYMALSVQFDDLERIHTSRQDIILSVTTDRRGRVDMETLFADRELFDQGQSRHNLSGFHRDRNLSVTKFNSPSSVGFVTREISSNNTVSSVHARSMRTKGEVTSVCYDGSLWVGTSKGVCQNSSVRSPIFTKNAVTSIACIQELQQTCFGHRNGSVTFLDNCSHKLINVLKLANQHGKTGPVVGLYPYYHGNELVISAMNSQLESWDLRMHRRLHVFKEHSNSFHYLSSVIDSRNRTLMAVSDDHVINVWSLSNGLILTSLTLPEDDLPLPVISHTHSFGGYHGYQAIVGCRGENIFLYKVTV